MNAAIAVGIIWLLFGAIGSYLSLDGERGFLCGLFLGPIGWFLAILLDIRDCLRDLNSKIDPEN